MAPRLSGQNCKFFKFLLSLIRDLYKRNNTKYRSLTWKPRSHVRILIYRTWPITKSQSIHWLVVELDIMGFASYDVASNQPIRAILDSTILQLHCNAICHSHHNPFPTHAKYSAHNLIYKYLYNFLRFY